MFLKTLSLTNYRCYESVADVPMHMLTIFVGENDAGKTVILDALQLLLESKRPSEQDFMQLNETTRAQRLVISGTFHVEDANGVPKDWLVPGKSDELKLVKTFSVDSVVVHVEGNTFADSRFSNFANEKADAQTELLKSIGIENPGGNKTERVDQFKEAEQSGAISKIPGNVLVKFEDLLPLLPRYERISAVDYKQPHLLVQKTLQMVVNACIYTLDSDSGQTKLIESLNSVKDSIESALDSKLKEATETLKAIHPKIEQVVTRPRIDFASSVTFPELMLDFGDGLGVRPVSSVGEGTKKRLWMGLLDWQRKAEQESENHNILRVYDEPDTSLHYDAQRKLFSNIIEATSRIQSKTQAVVCTHSLSLVDRAAGESINLIRVDEKGKREIEFLKGSSDEDIKEFLATVGQTVGLSNSALFFERAFLIVEGEAEENALPILYRSLYGKSMPEDGIVLVNLLGNGAWKPILKLLGQNRAHVISMLLDTDCQTNPAGALITPTNLAAVGFSAKFLHDQCFFIGTKEFEDAFASGDIAGVLNSHYPKASGVAWTAADIDHVRNTGQKFSKDLLILIQQEHKNRVGKPELSLKMAGYCTSKSQIPQRIIDAFEDVRSRGA